MGGWIKIHRQLKEHWLWSSDNRFKWWIDILFTVNYVDAKVLIKGTLIECKRGQSVRSLETWAKEWNVSKCTVRDFFKLLEKEQMIQVESLQITTRLTVCNYDSYQDELNTEQTPKKRTKNTEQTPSVYKQEDKESKQEQEHKYAMIFDEFRKQYEGTKKGLDVEFKNFKKHEDWIDILPMLLPNLNKQKEIRNKIYQMNEWLPNWKNLSTWINQRCWDEEITIPNKKQFNQIKQQSMQFPQQPQRKEPIPKPI